jgi:hypothetical protein
LEARVAFVADEPKSGFLGIIAMALGCAGLGAVIWTLVLTFDRRDLSALSVQYIALLGFGAMVVGAVALTQRWALVVAGALDEGGRRLRPPTRLGLRMLQAWPSGMRLALISTALLVVAAGGSSALTHALAELSRADADSMIAYTVFGGRVGSEDVVALGALLDTGDFPGVARVPGTRANSAQQIGTTTVFVGRCDSLAATQQAPASECGGMRTGIVALTPESRGPEDIPIRPGEAVLVPLETGGFETVTAPNEVIASDALGYSSALIVAPDEAPWLKDVADVDFDFRIASDDATENEFIGAITQAAPAAPVSIGAGGDPEARDRYLRQAAMLRFCNVVGFMFCLLCLALLGFSSTHEQAKSMGVLQLMGISRGDLRRASIVQKVLPVASAMMLFGAVAVLGGHAVLGTLGLSGAVYWPMVVQAAGAAVLAPLAMAAVGYGSVARLDLAEPDVRE